MTKQNNILPWVKVGFGIYCILLAVGFMSAGFKLASGGKEGAEALFAFANNPMTGLIIGILATSLVQSSSTVTAVIVALVAGGLPLQTAIPMVMGANIGTTVTNTIVSMGHHKEKEDFQKAISAATVHDFFNVLNVLIFLPLELQFGILEKSSKLLTGALAGLGIGGGKGFNPVKFVTKPIIEVAEGIMGGLPNVATGAIMAVIGLSLIFFSITFIGKLLKKLMVGRAKEILNAAVGRGPIAGIASGALVTVLVQSSSTTTSLAVPLAGTGVLKLKDIYPFTLGSNIGTCITALIAALGISGQAATIALQIAIIHLLFNTYGTIVIYGIPFLRNIPIHCAEWLARTSNGKKRYVFGYVFSIFFAVPTAIMTLFGN